MPRRIAEQICRIVQPQFLENPRPVGRNRIGRQRKLQGDLRDATALDEHLQNLEFPVGEDLVRRLFVIRAAPDVLRQQFGDGRGDVEAAAGDLGDGGIQDVRAAAFIQVGVGAAADGAQGELVFRVDRQHDDGEAREFAMQGFQCVEPVAFAEGNIQKYDLNWRRPQQADGVIGLYSDHAHGRRWAQRGLVDFSERACFDADAALLGSVVE